MKKNLVILSILLITISICTIGVGFNRNKKNEKKLVLLAQEYREKKLDEEGSKGASVDQNLQEIKIDSDEAEQVEDINEAEIAEKKAKQEEIDRIAAERAEATVQLEIAEYNRITSNEAEEALRAENEILAKLAREAKIEADKIKAAKIEAAKIEAAKIEAERLAKLEDERIAKEQMEKLKKEEEERLAGIEEGGGN